MMRRFVLASLMCFALGTWAYGADVKFEKHQIGTFRSEACGVADFNGDGKLDVVAGPVIYLAPEWRGGKFRENKGEGGK